MTSGKRNTVLVRSSGVILAMFAAGLLFYFLFWNRTPKTDHAVFDKSLDLLAYLTVLNFIAYLFRVKRWKHALAAVVLSCLVIDGFVWAGFVNPGFKHSLPKPLIVPLREAYMQDRPPIQALTNCGQYDDEVTYTLKPGDCRFANAEFDTMVHVNRLGLRDDESSLDAPDVIVAGDSFSMGWGVGQDETFASVVEKESGLKVLNAGVSSYGTVREMTLLGRLDLSRLKYLVVQYFKNDAEENVFYRDNDNKFVVTARDKFEGIQRRATRRSYYPGRYTLTLLGAAYNEVRSAVRPLLMGQMSPAEEASGDLSRAVPYFLNAMKHAAPWKKMNTKDLRILVLADGAFCGRLGPEMRREEYPFEVAQVSCEDVFTGDRSLSFTLDDHWNASGHRVVGRKVLDWLGRGGL